MATSLHKWTEFEKEYERHRRWAEGCHIGMIMVQFSLDGEEIATSGAVLPDEENMKETFWRQLAAYAQRRVDAYDQPR